MIPAFLHRPLLSLVLFCQLLHGSDWNLAVIGDGPAGYSAAIEASENGLRVIHFTGYGRGGQISSTPFLDNWPGASEGLSGADLIEHFKRQAASYENLYEEKQWVTGIRSQTGSIEIQTTSDTFFASTVVVAAGALPKIPGQLMQDFDNPTNTRIHTCTTCDGPRYKDQVVAILGGGNTAAEQALAMSGIASLVYLIHRSASMRALDSYQDIISKTSNIVVFSANNR